MPTRRRKRRTYRRKRNIKRRTLRYKKRRIRRKKRRKTRRRKGGSLTVAALTQKLIDGGVPESKINTWGTGNTKSVNNLLKEIQNKDTALEYIDGMITRATNVVHVNVYDKEDKAFSLYEIGHIDANDVLRPVSRTEGIREKFNPTEHPKDALKRGIREELGEKYSKSIRFMKGHHVYDIEKPVIISTDSRSYPGLPATYKTYREEVYMPELSVDHPPRSGPFKTEERNDDGSFKRYIVWEWRRN